MCATVPMLSNRLHTYYSACVSEVIWNVQGLGFFVGRLLLLLLLLVLGVLFTCKYEEFCDIITLFWWEGECFCIGNCWDCCIRGSQILQMNKYTLSTLPLLPSFPPFFPLLGYIYKTVFLFSWKIKGGTWEGVMELIMKPEEFGRIFTVIVLLGTL